MTHRERQLEPGQVIADRYRIEAAIGRGAMGVVWRAVHLQLESPVAIKFLNPAIADEPVMLERFMREARSAAAVRSSHVVQIFDYGVDRGAPYIAMELLVGEPLDARLTARGALAPPEVDKIFGEVARAVSVAHELGVVHRDIKPANIFIVREGGHEVTKVLDFGIAKLVDQRLEAPAGSGTHTGILVGTPNYMSPEQARGHRKVDHRSDLWALAVLAFECLTGRQPFESNSLGDLVVKICTAQPLVPSAVAALPPAFDAWFARGVDKDPALRFASAEEMADALHALLGAAGLGAESRPRSSPVRRLELVHTDGVGSTERTVSPVPGPHEPAEASLTAGAVAREVLTRSRAPSRRRKLLIATLPLVAIGVAWATSSPPPPADRAPPAATSAAPASAAAAPAATALTGMTGITGITGITAATPAVAAPVASPPSAAGVAPAAPPAAVDGRETAARSIPPDADPHSGEATVAPRPPAPAASRRLTKKHIARSSAASTPPAPASTTSPFAAPPPVVPSPTPAAPPSPALDPYANRQ